MRVVRSKSLFSVPPRSVLLTLSELRTEILIIFLRFGSEGGGGCGGGGGDLSISPNTAIFPKMNIC